MKYKVYTVFDSAVQEYRAPVHFRSELEMRRVFGEVVMTRKDSDLSKYAEQFTVFDHGEFDSASGMFEVGVPKPVCRLDSLRNTGE